MSCNEKPCREVTYTFVVTLGSFATVPGSEGLPCPSPPDPTQIDEIKDKILARLRALFPDQMPSCDKNCRCEFDATVVKQLERTIPERTYRTSSAPDTPVQFCHYTVGATARITRTTKQGTCEATQDAVDQAFPKKAEGKTKTGKSPAKQAPKKPRVTTYLTHPAGGGYAPD